MEYREIPAPPAFRPVVDCVWFLTGRGDEYHPQPVVPDGRLELLVHRGDPFTRMALDGSRHLQDELLVAGQLTGPIQLQPGSWIDVVGVRLTPLGAHAILTLPLRDLTNDVVSLREVSPRVAAQLQAAAARGASQRDCARAILMVLMQRVPQGVDHQMGVLLRAVSSRVPVSLREIAVTFGMSVKTLERRFDAEVGLSPKMYQRVMRFRRAFHLLQDHQGGRARIAATTGYFDQAHLIRDFRQFTGTNPRRFFRPDTPLAGLLLSGLAESAAG